MKKFTILVLFLLLIPLNLQDVGHVTAPVTYEEYWLKPDGTFLDKKPGNLSRIDENLYRFTGDIYGRFVIQKSNSVIDGAGYSLIGNGTNRHGLDLVAENITVKNLTITRHGAGGIVASKSCNLVDNTIVDNKGGIGLGNVHDQTIIISGNKIERNNASIGISGYAKQLLITKNTIKENVEEIYCQWSKNIEFSNNIISDTILENGIRVFNCENITIRDNNISNNKLDGVIFQNVPTFKIFGNTFSGNGGNGVKLYSTLFVNEVYNNNFTSNGRYGLEVLGTDAALKIFHNRFDNPKNAYNPGSTLIVWDNGYPSGGNYWSDYKGVDQFSGAAQNVSGTDGIGDTQYQISTNNRDRYPLMIQSSGATKAETELRLEVQVTDDKKVKLLGKTFMKPVGKTVWTEFYNANIEIIIKDPTGNTVPTINTKTKSPEFTPPTVSGFNEVTLDLASSPVEGDWTFTASFEGNDDYLPCKKSEKYTVIDTSLPPSGDKADVNVKVTEDSNPVDDAMVIVNGVSKTTGNDGIAWFDDLPLGTYAYSVTKLGYNDRTGSFILQTGDEEKNVEVLLQRISTKIPTTITCVIEFSYKRLAFRALLLGEAESYKISGKITPPLSGITVKLTQLNQGVAGGVFEEITNSFGEYMYNSNTDLNEYMVIQATASWEGDELYQGSTSITTTKQSGTPYCVIATAAYGSEMHPVVKQMRSFRDAKVASTFTGENFLNVFLAWYYSWGTPTAKIIAGNEALKGAARIVLTPLTLTMWASEAIYDTFSPSREIAAGLSILFAALSCGIFYLTPFFSLVPATWRLLVNKRMIVMTFGLLGLMTLIGFLLNSVILNTLGIVGVSLLITFTSAYISSSTLAYALRRARLMFPRIH